MKTIFTGCCTALVTPFTENGVDYPSFERLIEFQIEQGIDALLVNGTTGEPATMTWQERIEVVEFAKQVINGRVPMIVGCGSNCTQTSIENAKSAEKAGADALLIVTPYYNKCTQKGLIAHFNAITDSVNLPAIVYNVPGRTGVNILPSTLQEIAKNPKVVGIKEASGNMQQACEIAANGEVALYSGEDALAVPMMSVGAKGLISVTSNILPGYMHKLLAEYSTDPLVSAQMQNAIQSLMKALFCEVNPIPVKYALSKMGYIKNILRMPLTPIEEADAKKVDDAMYACGLFGGRQ